MPLDDGAVFLIQRAADARQALVGVDDQETRVEGVGRAAGRVDGPVDFVRQFGVDGGGAG